MPVSKSKRKKRGGRRRRPPSVQTPPKPKGTPRWVAPAFFGLMGAGVLLIILNYFPFWDFKNWVLFLGLALMAAAFGVATKLR